MEIYSNFSEVLLNQKRQWHIAPYAGTAMVKIECQEINVMTHCTMIYHKLRRVCRAVQVIRMYSTCTRLLERAAEIK